MGAIISNSLETIDRHETLKAISFFSFSKGILIPIGITTILQNPHLFFENPLAIIEPLYQSNFKGDNSIPKKSVKYSLSNFLKTINGHFILTKFQLMKERIWIFSDNSANSTLYPQILNAYQSVHFQSSSVVSSKSIFSDDENYSSFLNEMNSLLPKFRNLQQPVNIKTQKIPTLKTSSCSISSSNSLPLTPIIHYDVNKLFFVCPGLYFSGEKAALDHDNLKRIGITHIINLTDTHPSSFQESFQYLCFRLNDGPFEELTTDFWNASTYIDNVIKSGGSILVHCRKGASRSPSLCILYLMDIKGMTFSDALKKIQKINPGVNINSGFLEQLQNHEISNSA